jgi:hypothetical protein
MSGTPDKKKSGLPREEMYSPSIKEGIISD